MSMKPFKPMRFVIMGNVFATTKSIDVTYDLKGSTVGRSASEKERSKPNCVFKDNDILVRTSSL